MGIATDDQLSDYDKLARKCPVTAAMKAIGGLVEDTDSLATGRQDLTPEGKNKDFRMK